MALTLAASMLRGKRAESRSDLGEAERAFVAPSRSGTRTLPAASYCARLLADLGAEVIKLEPPDGDPARHLPPRMTGQGAWFGFLNYGKTAATGDSRSC